LCSKRLGGEQVTVEEIEIQVTASVESALKEFKKMVPEIRKQIKELQSEFSNIDMKSFANKTEQATKQVQNALKKIDAKSVTKQVGTATQAIQKEFGSMSKSTEKQQELLYEKIKEKQAQLANMKSNGVPSTASDEEIKAKMKETGKIPELIDKKSILEVEAEIERLQNKLIELQKGNPNEVNFTINADSSSQKQTFSKEQIEIKKNIQELVNELDKTPKGEQYNEIMNKISALNRELQGLPPKVQKTNQELSNINTQENVTNIDVTPNTKSMSMWDILKNKIEQIQPVVERFKMSLEGGNSNKQLELLKYKISEIEEKLQNAKDGIIHMDTKEILQAEAELERLNGQKAKLESSGGKVNIFSKMLDSIRGLLPSMSQVQGKFNGLSGISLKVNNNIKQMGTGMKQGLSHILRYAGALFSLQGIYSVLSSSASSWLSSQNAGAQQLSTNIDYMKNAMGSALAPIIQWVTNLVYNLMKAIQSVVYALFKVNIFANASAKSYGSMAGSAKKAKNETKQLAGIHDEINNIQNNDASDGGGSSGTGSPGPSFDLSTLDPTGSIIDAIRNGDWYRVGSLIAEKLNQAMASIDWGKIQEGAKLIATNIGNFINGFVDKLDWNLLGYTLGQGINTAFMFADTLLTTINFRNIGSGIATGLNSAISTINWELIGKTFADGLNAMINLAYGFVTTFDFKKFGSSIATSINSFFSNVEWGALAQTLSEGLKGVFDTVTGFFTTLDWSIVVDSVIEFFANVDYSGISDSFFEMLGSAVGSLVNLGVIIGDKINEAIDSAVEYFMPYVELCGGNIIEGMLLGIIDALISIGNWVREHIFQPFIDGFKKAFGIHSPSTVMAEMGTYIIEGLKEGIVSLIDTIKEIWENMKETAITKFTELKDGAVEKITNLKEKAIELWENIRLAVSEKVINLKDKVLEVWENIKTSVGEKVSNLKENIINKITEMKDNVVERFSNIKERAQNIWGDIKNNISNKVQEIKDGIGNKFQEAYDRVTSIFGNIQNFFGGIWERVKGTFSELGTKIGDSIGGSVKQGINGIISSIENTINKAINLINGAIKLINKIPGVSVGDVPKLSLPRLAKGNVAYSETVAIFGEYAGASNNPEITAPQSIMEETFERVLSKNSSGNQPINLNLTVKVGNEKLGTVLLEDLRNMKRQTGKDIEALVGG